MCCYEPSSNVAVFGSIRPLTPETYLSCARMGKVYFWEVAEIYHLTRLFGYTPVVNIVAKRVAKGSSRVGFTVTPQKTDTPRSFICIVSMIFKTWGVLPKFSSQDPHVQRVRVIETPSGIPAFYLQSNQLRSYIPNICLFYH